MLLDKRCETGLLPGALSPTQKKPGLWGDPSFLRAGLEGNPDDPQPKCKGVSLIVPRASAPAGALFTKIML
jgi:hypothetical protein